MAYYHILSLDGGGIRGVLTARLLERLDAVHTAFLEQVDLIAGTSTGGILALWLAAGLPPTKIAQLYQEAGSKVFAESFWERVRDLDNLTGADYSNQALSSAIWDQLGDITLGDLHKKVVISSFDLDNGVQDGQAARTWKPKFFHNFPGSDSDAAEKVLDVALRTSAAPTYFPIYQGYVDGGVVANDPALCGLAQALHPATGGQQLDGVTLLSLGTGLSPHFLPEMDASWGLVQWAPHLITMMMEGSAGVTEYECQQILGERYMRLNARLASSISMDQPGKIPELLDAANAVDINPAAAWLEKYYPS